MRYDNFTIESETYRNDFWNTMMKGLTAPYETMNQGAVSSDTYVLPYDSNRKYIDALKEECIFRQIATNVKSKDSDLDIWVSDSDEPAEWAPRNAQQFIKDAVGQFDKKKMSCHKLAIITRMDMDFMQDVKFDMENYLVKHFARRFGKAEEAAFVNGSGVEMPTGILHETNGAEVGVTAKALTFDDVIALYFSAKPEYRTKGTWLMNDETAKVLRTLKDKDGNHLWNHNSDTIMGRPVQICNAMPSAGKVIAFGDFSYYWIVNRMPISVRAIVELYIRNHQVGYLAHEYLDAKLIRPEAIKVLELE
ncbi:MAG: phage major capsid protein [Eubacteriales bacterium]|nr:phage major capsid protein [Eubacteriales bacterium]